MIKLKWSEDQPSNEEIRYDHCKLQTPIGEFIIKWKGYKDYPSFGLYQEGEYTDSFNSKGEAQEFVVLKLNKIISDLNRYLENSDD